MNLYENYVENALELGLIEPRFETHWSNFIRFERQADAAADLIQVAAEEHGHNTVTLSRALIAMGRIKRFAEALDVPPMDLAAAALEFVDGEILDQD